MLSINVLFKAIIISWGGTEQRKDTALADWDRVCQLKEKGGHGLIRKMNALLLKIT